MQKEEPALLPMLLPLLSDPAEAFQAPLPVRAPAAIRSGAPVAILDEVDAEHLATTRSSGPATSASTKGVTRVEVEAEPGEPLEKLLRRFQRAVKQSGHTYKLRQLRTFESNTEKRIRKSKERLRRAAMDRRKKARAAAN